VRILRISLCNLASLAGTHTVDFTKDPLRTAGLFSISGPTGSGKSTLLDALCLALYDATPRLRQVGRLSKLANGDHQNDPRTLLRRGTGEGFAEVAFVGVDQQPYTARWSVRRSRRSAEGSLQQVDMVLYSGHIATGSEGVVAEGGRKTQVLKAIEDKIGLTFEQFTRAVLLAQNDFATFLKADDRERAEILQALTGTERFESISISIYQRCATEQKALDALRSQLAGAAPFDTEARAAAEERHAAVCRRQDEVNSHQKTLQSQLEWFTKRQSLLEEKSKADRLLNDAIERQQNAEPRRVELAITEEVSREARPIRDAELHALHTEKLAATTLEASQAEFAKLKEGLQSVTDRHLTAEKVHESLVTEFKSLQPLLQKARELDTTIRHLNTQFEQAVSESNSAQKSHESAAENLRKIIAERDSLLQWQTKLQVERDRLKIYAPFASEPTRWIDRLQTAIGAKARISETQAAMDGHAQTLTAIDQQLTAEQAALDPLKATLDKAVGDLSSAREMESKFDVAQIATDRERLESIHQVLLAFFEQLKKSDKLRIEVKELRAKIQELDDAQALDATALARIQNQDWPMAENAVHVAKAQLDLMIAAIDDHAKRLRTSLQEDQECPVCGSTSHPYTQHAPQQDATAVKAARKNVKDLEKQRDEISRQQTRLQTSIEGRSTQLEELTAGIKVTQDEFSTIVFSSPESEEIADVLSFEEESRRSVLESKLLKLNTERRQITAIEQKARDAALAVRTAQETKDAAEGAVEAVADRLQKLTSDRVRCQDAVDHAKSAHQQAARVYADELGRLHDVWEHVPSSRDQFEQAPESFRESFSHAIRDCSGIEVQLADIVHQIEKANAAIQPLEESGASTSERLNAAVALVVAAKAKRDEQLQQRQHLLEGLAVDVVEKESVTKIEAAAVLLAEITGQKNDLERKLAASESDLKTRTTGFEQACAATAASTAARTKWIEDFNSRHSVVLTPERLDELLARDFAWIHSERQALNQLNDAVSSARGQCKVRGELLEKHDSEQPTGVEEAAVPAAMESVRQELAQIKVEVDETQSILRIDDDRRKTNERLVAEISAQDAKADPWQKLSDLLGSADGSKFRMIAQRTTLDVLLSHANYQLSQLASRYCLERIPESLNLIIVDRDMGDERRSVHSLSGGESFLVSLALALALASLTSNRLRIESLFIDEGFGSLDPDTLNTAMGALMQLESQGRKVGVISHVTEMTDAIPTQIRVVKGRRGASRIVVPGVEHTPEEAGNTPPSVTKDVTDEPPKASIKATSSESVSEIASRLVEILRREKDAGKSKVSSKALRDELQCDSAVFKKAQAVLKDQIVFEGRSIGLRTEQNGEM
jgi:exonuclease SbcC